MTTPRRERLRQELREEILAAASDLFVKEGFASVSMRKIADKVGCAPGTIYLHFEDKDSILTAICLQTFRILEKRMDAIANDPGDPLDRLRRGGRAYMQFALDHPQHYVLTFGPASQAVRKDEETHQVGIHSFDCLRRGVAGCIKLGLVRQTDAEEVAQTLWAALHGLVMLLIAKPSFPYIEQSRLMESMLDIIIEGIRKK